MGRLTEILHEQIEGAVIDAADYKKYSDAGNLFRLMMITNPDQQIPQTSNRGLVSNMITGQDQAAVKKLQTYFNTVNKALQDGKNPSIAEKKSFFVALLDLLLPMTKDNALLRKSTTIASAFASGGASTVSAKRAAVVAIGKGLLSNTELNLTGPDKNVIKGFIIGFEAMVDQAGEVAQAAQPTVAVPEPPLMPPKPIVQDVPHVAAPVIPEPVIPTVSVPPPAVIPEPAVPPPATSLAAEEDKFHPVKEKLAKQTITEVKKALENTDAIIAAKTKPPETSLEIKKMLTSNKTADIFHVNLQGDNAAINKEVNAFITKFYDDQVKQYGNNYDANFATQFVSDILKSIDNVKVERPDKKNGGKLQLNALRLFWSQMRISAGKDKYGDMYVDVDNSVKDADPGHSDVLNLAYVIRGYDKGNREAHTDFVQIPAASQSSGINKELFRRSLELYKAIDVKKVDLLANIDVGGYAWFRYGFVPKNYEQIEKISQWMDGVSGSVLMALGNKDGPIIADHIKKNTKTMTKEIQNLIDLVAKGKTPEAEKIIPLLFGNCSIEFQMTYDNPKKFKTLPEDVAVKNFKPVGATRSGTKYAISYKALLSLNAMKDVKGYSVIPMLFLGMENSLEWEGELDMKDLSRTHAYLNAQK